jgi:chromate transporter
MIQLILVFLYIGLFTIGGGMVAIPLIQQVVVQRGWISLSDFFGMVAIAQSTPGPIGINIATYVGFDQFGVGGAVVATISFIIPSFLIVSALSDLLKKYRYSPLVKNWFLYLKASIIGLIGYAFVNVADFALFSSEEWIDLKALGLLIVLAVVYYYLRKKPWIVIIIGGVCGVFLF